MVIKLFYKFFYFDPRGFPLLYSILGEKRYAIVNFIHHFLIYTLLSVPIYGVSYESKLVNSSLEQPNLLVYSFAMLGVYFGTYIFTTYFKLDKLILKSIISNSSGLALYKISLINFNYLQIIYLSGFPFLFLIFSYSYNMLNINVFFLSLFTAIAISIILNQLILFIQLVSMTNIFLKKTPLSYILIIGLFIGYHYSYDLFYSIFDFILILLIPLFILVSINLILLKKCSFQLSHY